MIPESYQLNLNLHHLHYFYVVAREGGYRRAAELLRIQQPAISKMVHQLEDNLGVKLFERVGRGVQLTGAGRDVLAHAQRVFGEVETLRRSLGEIRGEPHGPLAVGTTDAIATTLGASTLASLLTKHPKIYPILQTGPAESIFPKILQRRLEFGLFFHIPDLPAGLERTDFAKIHFKLVVKKGLEKRRSIMASFIGSREVDDLSNQRFPTLERIQRDIPEAKITISSNSLNAHRELVLQGLGVSILPEFLVAQDLTDKRVVALYPREKFEFTLKLITLKGFAPSLNAQTFLDTLARLLQLRTVTTKKNLAP